MRAGLVEALEALWRANLTEGDSLSGRQEFKDLVAVIGASYPDVGTGFFFPFALMQALAALGLATDWPPSQGVPRLTPQDAATALDAALTAKGTTRVHLCPLDWADNPPAVSFGSAEMRLFTAAELRAFVGPRSASKPDTYWRDMSRFHWLAVREEVTFADPQPAARHSPWLHRPFPHDFGAIQPHKGKFAPVVEEALFMLLLAPWEEWAEAPEVDWRGFQIPWVFTVDRDIFVQPQPLPAVESLTWEPVAFSDVYGNVFEEEQPAHFRLKDEAEGLPAFASAAAWDRWQQASRSPLFATPMVHFMVRAFFSDGMDELMAHLLALEAALSVQKDFRRGKSGRSATDYLTLRADSLVGGSAAEDYRRLLRLRGDYVHGRPLADISSDDRNLARSLARRVVLKLLEVGASGAADGGRDAYLTALAGPESKA